MKNCELKYFMSGAIFMVISLLFAGCEKDINLKLEEGGGRLVLFSFLTADSILSVHLSKSVSYSSYDDYERIYDGYVIINQNGVKVESFAYPYSDLWAECKQIDIEEEDFFEFEAGDSDGNKVFGSVTIPVAIQIEKIDTTRSYDKNSIDCELIFEDPANEDNYYQLVLSEEVWEKIGSYVKYSYQVVDFSKDDPAFYIRDQEGSLLGGIDFLGTFKDELFNGETDSLEISIPSTYVEVPQANKKRKLTFMLLSLSCDYFDYIRSRVVAEYNYELPIVDPIKIHSNVTGGLGLVGAISLATDSLVFFGPDYE